MGSGGESACERACDSASVRACVRPCALSGRALSSPRRQRRASVLVVKGELQSSSSKASCSPRRQRRASVLVVKGELQSSSSKESLLASILRLRFFASRRDAASCKRTTRALALAAQRRQQAAPVPTSRQQLPTSMRAVSSTAI
eukprot:1096769-Pleurochrysis_carterae.AAC.1